LFIDISNSRLAYYFYFNSAKTFLFSASIYYILAALASDSD